MSDYSDILDSNTALDMIRKYAQGKAMRPPVFNDKRHITAKLSLQAIAGLRAIAKELGYIHNGHGNVNLLLEALGTGTITINQAQASERAGKLP